MLPNNPKAACISGLLADLDHWVGRLRPGSYGSNELLFWLVAKIPRDVWEECQATAERKARTLTYEDLSLLLELALEKGSDQHLNAYRPGGGNSGNLGLGYQGHRPVQGTTPKDARYIGNVQDLFWCNTRDEQGGLVPAPDCDQHECFLVQGKKQETDTGRKAKMPEHYRCTIACAFSGKRKHYEDECYHKERLSAKLKSEAGNGGGRAGGKSNGEKGKGKSQRQGKDQGKAQGKGGRSGGPDKKNQDKNKDKNQDRSGGSPNPTLGGTNPEPSTGQQNPGPTTRSQTQAQKEQGAKRGNEDVDESNPHKQSRFMRMAPKLRRKGFDVTCAAEF